MPFTNGINLIQRFTPANNHLDEDVFQIRLQKTSSGRLQDVLMKTNIFLLTYVFRRGLQDVFKMSSRCLAITSLRRFQDIFKTPCQNVLKTSLRCLQDIFKTSRQYVWKTSSRRFEDVSSS